jgi:CRISPR-associated endonuclease/helicase Cas3
MQGESGYWRYWGKAQRPTDSNSEASYHLLPYHCLDVAAVGKVYLDRHAALRTNWAARLNITPERLAAWVTFFLAIHDIGKFSHRFQSLRQDICQLLGNDRTPQNYTVRHDSLGQLFFEQKIHPLAIEQGWFGLSADENDQEYWSDNWRLWAKAVTGHHGKPPSLGNRPVLADHFQHDQDAAIAFASACADLLLPENPGKLPDGNRVLDTLAHLSWRLAGLSVLCDWVGSNEDFFRYRTEPMPLFNYWHDHARPQAEKALNAINLIPRTIRPQTLSSLFEFLQPPAVPTPLQQTAAELPINPTAHLFILEDVTGAGKTEAALMLAYRLIALGQAGGFYLGLPTMATSNAMFKRIQSNHLPDKFFQQKPNLVLAHSASRLAPVFDALSRKARESDYQADEASAGSERNAWFADSRKKALLADLGVGTLDQALLAVLYSRHQSLRLLGLSRKVLIVDEVHACDAYMLKLLEVLLTFHAADGGSVILLSATLPHKTRQTLVNAYCKGLGRRSASPLQSIAYPLLTQIDHEKISEIALDTRPEVARTVLVESVHSEESAVKLLLSAQNENRCACWIRNTVDDAIAACEALRQAGVKAEDLILFHARFALADRMDIEGRVLDFFGPNSNAEKRRGKILVATQVVEQSLDLDFDLLLSDLAPVDLLIQRAGRLCRHVRDCFGNRADVEGRGMPTLWIVGPEFTDSPATNWLSASFPGTAAVYPDHGRLWLTARLFNKFNALVMPGESGKPGGARTLVESVYGDESDTSIPKTFQAKSNKAEGENSAKRGIGSANTITFGKPYEHKGIEPWDEARIPTRIEDQPSVTVRLARLETGGLRPWYDSANQYAWELSQLSVRYSLFAEELHDPKQSVLVESCRATMPDQGKWSKLLVLAEENGVWTGTAKNGKGETVSLCYDAERGLRKQ